MVFLFGMNKAPSSFCSQENESQDAQQMDQDPQYDKTLLDRVPADFRNFTLEKLVHNRFELDHFRQFLSDNFAAMDLMCWMDIEAFRSLRCSVACGAAVEYTKPLELLPSLEAAG